MKDITETALGVWPKNAELLSVRSDGATRLLSEARALPAERREKAIELLNAALDLNPDDQEIRRLLAALSAPPNEPARTPSAAPSAVRKAPKSDKRSPVSESPPAAAPPASAEAPNVNVGAEPAPSAERWL